MSATDPLEAGDDPIAYFLQDVEYQGKTERTYDAYERVLRDFERFVREEYPRANTLDEVTHRACMAWLHRHRGSVARSTLATYASYLHRFYAYMTQIGVFAENPMALVIEQMDESIDVDPTRREIPLERMREFVDGVGHPLDRALIVTLLKTGIRAGELCNLDLRDLNLDFESLGIDPDPRPQLHGKPDSLYVAPDPARGAVVNGERRAASNKRRRPTVIPVDDELARVLEAWLAVRPDTRSAADPLFVSTSGKWGARLTTHMLHHTVEKHARRVDWHRTGGGAEENVTPHYFRHFFTTYLRNATGERGVVKYLRGDVADDVIDTYTHDWGDTVRETYERHIYRLS
ncbi:tyrosine-type recombinase/integrase [Halalkalicoccus sp. NIPERK01]|uniref:tyrosine-type recombinase/integrase n=1 Tax=Halalkalicoccus sp. NIPERK01 TaxID=3053469 RepID=UPI00256ED0D7|nr:tyrosine-type recombinase/integrase [Halalkalicoccus sp. NIPERK01]MDL5360765.1 tyrosine-type recombinase/integrase [Halalkalicoccus sp. NIPERK01]